MLFHSALPLVATTLFLSTTTSAAPTRTHCRCTVVADAPPAIFTPSAAHWTPAELLPSTSAPSDLCSNLGPQLEHFQRTAPDVYASYVSKSDAASSGKLLVNFASKNQIHATKQNVDIEPRPTSRPHQRIVCHSESDPFTDYHSSFVTLWALQFVVAMAILACVVEGVHLCLQWYRAPDASAAAHSLRVSGGQSVLLEVSSVQVRDEKSEWKATMPVFVVQAPNGERVCITYDEEEEDDDDDEVNRPVM